MGKLNTVERIVEQILNVREDARENDDILYLCVCEHFHKGVSLMSLKDFLVVRNKMTCPNFASVTRARRKVFEKRPELKPKKITKLRKDAEREYVDYALNN